MEQAHPRDLQGREMVEAKVKEIIVLIKKGELALKRVVIEGHARSEDKKGGDQMIRKHEPYPIEKMYEIAPQCTICETLRQIWQNIDLLKLNENDDRVIRARLLVREAVSMGKSMDEKLRKYNKVYAKDFFDKRRKIYIDCGAWEGDSILAFKKYHKDYEIFGFECEPRLEKDLVALSLKEKFYLFFKAVYVQDGPICLYQGIKDFTESSSVLANKTTYIDNKNFIEIEAIDFSQWVIDNFDRDDFIVCKMNIEGAEYDVLEKMVEDGSIHYINHLYIEWHSKKIRGFDQKRHADLKEMLSNMVVLHDWFFTKRYKADPFVGLLI